MKLYSETLSPFAARIRISIKAKRLPIEIIADGGFDMRSEAFAQLNPMRKVPTLLLDDGTAIPESEVIVEYLEDAFPDISLRPNSDIARAQVRLLARVTEIYVYNVAMPLFTQLDPAHRDHKIVATALTEIERGLGYVEHFLGGGAYAFGDTLTTADGCLAPFLFYIDFLSGCFNCPALLANHAKISRYWRSINDEPIVGLIIAEMKTSMAAALSSR